MGDRVAVLKMTVANAVVLDLAAIDDGKSLRALAEFREFRLISGLPVGSV